MSRVTTMTNPTDGFWDIRESAVSFNERFASLLSLHDDGSGQRPDWLPPNGLWADTPDGTQLTTVYLYTGAEDMALCHLDRSTGVFTLPGQLSDEGRALLREALGLPEPPTAVDALAPLRVNRLGTGYEHGEPLGQDAAAGGTNGLRNVVLSARQRKGYPAYLATHEWIDMECANNVPSTPVGTVSASSQYSADHNFTVPLVNQVAFTNSNRWLTPNNTRQGYWQYDFTRPRVLTGMFMAGGEVASTPKTFRLLGWNETSQLWDTFYEVLNNKALPAAVNAGADQGRMFWFTDNQVAYKRVRLQIDDVTGASNNRIGIKCLRFYEQLLPGLSEYDTALVASEEEPFLASIACGRAENGASRDFRVDLREPVRIAGDLLREMSRNYVYLAPAGPDGSCPDYCDPDRAVYLPDAGVWLVLDPRKVHYDSLEELEKQCFALVQCQATEAAEATTATLTHNLGSIRYPILWRRVSVHPEEGRRGAPAAFGLLSGSHGYVGQSAYLYNQAALRDKVVNVDPKTRDFTIELDFKLDQALADTYGHCCLFDAGWEAKGPIIYYHHQSGTIQVRKGNRNIALAPYDADKNWHTLSLSGTGGRLYLHVDGRCLIACDGAPSLNTAHDAAWAIGGYRAANTEMFKGWVNNFRYTLGQCLYQSEDYQVAPVFSLSLVPDRTLRWDPEHGTVREWRAADNAWRDAPLLPLGHIDTGYLEHLHTDSPRGCFADGHGLNAVVEFGQSGSANASTTAIKLFNFDQGGDNGYATPNADAAEHSAWFRLTRPLAFAELRLITCNRAWTGSPCVYVFEGSHNGETWTPLVDRSEYQREGSVNWDHKHLGGNVPNFYGWKRHAIEDPTAYSHYRLRLLPKQDVPNYTSHTFVRLQLPLRGATPEIVGISSYAVGGLLRVGPVMLAPNTSYSLPMPFGGAPFEVGGRVVPMRNQAWEARELGHDSYYSDVWYTAGEYTATREDELLLTTGYRQAMLVNGILVNGADAGGTYADAYITARRTF